MTAENLMSKITEYASWLYTGREWARWELLTIALTAMVLLLFILVVRRRAKSKRAAANQIREKSSPIGINLDSGKTAKLRSKVKAKRRRLLSISKDNGSKNLWKQTTKQWKNYQILIEQLQHEIAKYKEAEINLEQQFARLKAANEQLRQEISSTDKEIQTDHHILEPEVNRPRTIGSFSKQNRILNPSGDLSEDS